MKKRSKIQLYTVTTICFVMGIIGCEQHASYPINDKDKILEIFGDPLALSSYGTLSSVEATGYFKVAKRYVHAPNVEFEPVEQADYYDIFLLQDSSILGVTRTRACSQIVEGGWDRVRTGKAGVAIVGYNKEGEKIAVSRAYPFYVVSDFSKKASAEKKYSYREAAIKAFRSLQELSKHPYFETLVTSKEVKDRIKQPAVLTSCLHANSYPGSSSFPNLHDWVYVEMVESMNKFADDGLKKELQDFAVSTGEHLLMSRVQGDDFKYTGMLYMSVDANCQPVASVAYKDEDKDKLARVVEPGKSAYSGTAFLKLYKMIGDTRYHDAAIDMAETFCNTQRENGSWYARVDGKTGEPIGGTYSTSVAAVVSFLDRLNQIKPDSKWVVARDKAIQWLEKHPLKTHGWVVNFDDTVSVATEENPYNGLSNWDLFEAVRFIAEKPALFSEPAHFIHDNLRWNDDHFVYYGDDPFLWWQPYYPTCGEQGQASGVFFNGCWCPMDFHTANWGTALLNAYSLTKDKVYLEKARYAANALTQYQVEDGRTITWMADKTFGLSTDWWTDRHAGQYSWWPTGSATSAWLWSELVNIGMD